MPSLNLIPADVLLQRSRRRRRRFWAFMIIVATVLVLIPVGRELHAGYQLSSQRAALEAVSESLKESRRDRDESVHKLKLLRQEIDRADRLRHKRRWTAMITLIAHGLPRGAWLTTLSTDPARPHVQSAVMSPMMKPRSVDVADDVREGAEDYGGLIGKGGPHRLIVEGEALGIEEIFLFVSAVHRLGVFDSAVLKSVTEGEKEGLPINHFKLNCEW